MRLVHSFSTKNLSAERLRLHTYYFTVSAIYAKQSGFEIVLHTDNRGARALQFAPYDQVYIDLENITIANRIYAWPKFKAMENEKPESFHIDGDVFIKNPNISKYLTFDDCDIIIQNIEIKGVEHWGGLWSESTQAFARCEYPTWMTRDCTHMYNCGIIGFKDNNVMKEYHNWYWTLISRYSEKGIDLHSVPDLIAEQQMLYDFCKHKGLKVKELLTFPKLNERADEIGYQHIIGNAKNTQLKTCCKLLKKLDINVYKKLEKVSWDF